jgi:asparagine synthase (glutamine-hydrolysing)
MCGLNGFNFSDEKLIQQMNRKIKHRGPDDDGYFVNDKMSLGNTRLSIIDLSAQGHQPMVSADGRYVIVYNGELYNFQDIKNDLKSRGFSFKSNSDTEVVLKAFLADGLACLQKFNGIFALAIWDKEKKELLAARDHFGIKPFFYYLKNSRFIFSSEIKSILQQPVDKTIDYDSLNLYFRFLYISGPQTIFKHIKKLPPGHYLIFRNNNLEVKRYYELPTNKINLPFAEAKDLVRTKFDQAVQRQLIADRPLGIFLSGGIDSTAILGAMARVTKHQIKTFTVKFAIDVQSEKFNNDSALAKKSSEYYKTDHHELLVTPQDTINNLEPTIYAMDDLVSNHAQISTYLLAKFAKQSVDVVLGGDGGDEIFGGYSRYYYSHLIDRFQKIPAPLRKNFITQYLAKISHKENIYNKLNVANGLDLFWQFRAQKEKMVGRFLKPEINNLARAKEIINQKYFSQKFSNYTEAMMRIDLDDWLVDESLTKSDKLTMAWGLEERVPLLDKELVELAMSLPLKYKINKKDQGKYIFREAMKDYLPDYIYHKTKSGWFSPAAKWLRTDLKAMAYEVLSEDYNAATREMFDFKVIREILDNHLDKKEYALNTIWSLLTFQIWYKLFK